jgi:hypothetical protein
VKEVDEMRAFLAVAFRVRVPRMENAEIVSEARELDAKLGKGPAEVWPREKSAIAETLIQMFKVLDARLQARRHFAGGSCPGVQAKRLLYP